MDRKQYWIKGEDGEEYGPADLDELRGWVAEDRAGLGTEVRTGGPDAEWTLWQDHPELVVLVAERRARRRGALFAHLPGVQPASLLSRLAAFLADILIVFVLLNIVTGLVKPFLPEAVQAQFSQASMERVAEGQPVSQELMMLALGVTGLFGLLLVIYVTLFHGAMGQTPGKRLFRVRVVDARGLTIGYRQALVRGIALLISLLPYGLGCVMAVFTPKRQAFHDWIARTYVVGVPTPTRREH